MEQSISRCIRQICDRVPDGAEIDDCDSLRDLSRDLDAYIPWVLTGLYPDWNKEMSLDGVLPRLTRKRGEQEIETIGVCYTLSHRGGTGTLPMHLRIQASFSSDEISWFELRLGECGEDGMLRDSSHRTLNCLYLVEGDCKQIDWFWEVTFGEKEPC